MVRKALSKTQQWFRDLSSALEISFQTSGLIEHAVTKGESREYQVLDILRRLLPTRVSLETNVVIIDSSDVESPKFDGVLFDRNWWPLLLQEDCKVAMIESVLAAIEIKSSLNTTELGDIFGKATALRQMKCAAEGAFVCPPLVTGFAYTCDNTNLSFFDFAVLSHSSPETSPSLVCALNRALLGFGRIDGSAILPTDAPSGDQIPILYRAEKDTLLFYLYLLSRWACLGADTVEVFRTYSNAVFSETMPFYFDREFLDALAKDTVAQEKARGCFARHSSRDVRECYAEAQRLVGFNS